MISVCILAKNAEPTLRATLDSVRLFSEVIFLDNGSTDATLQIAKTYPNVKIFHTEFIGFGAMRNQAANLASHDWILFLDADEVLSFPERICQMSLNESIAYVFPRYNFYNGKRIRGCGWDPEWIARLYHRKKARFSEDQVHEALIASKTQQLPYPLLHTPYRSTHDFLAKMQHYSTLFASQYQYKKSSSFSKALAHGFYAFIRSYFFKRGIFCGKEGLIISFYNGSTTFYKYLKLLEFNQMKKN